MQMFVMQIMVALTTSKENSFDVVASVYVYSLYLFRFASKAI